jgi:hypothetical protein
VAEIGEITGQKIAINKDGESNVRLLQVQISEDEDVQTVEQFRMPGDDAAPINSDDDNNILSKCVVFDIGESWKIAFVVDDGIVPDSTPGVKKIYSIDPAIGAIAAWQKFLTDGVIEINGNADNAVAWQDLDDAFNTAVTGFVAQVQAELVKIQTAIAAIGGSYTPGTLTLDLSGAKVDEVKLP